MQCGQGSLNAKMATLARSFSAGGSKRAQGFHFVFNHLCCVSNLGVFSCLPAPPWSVITSFCCFLTTEHLHQHNINTHTLTTHTKLYQIPNKFDDFCWHIYLSIYRSGCSLPFILTLFILSLYYFFIIFHVLFTCIFTCAQTSHV